MGLLLMKRGFENSGKEYLWCYEPEWRGVY